MLKQGFLNNGRGSWKITTIDEQEGCKGGAGHCRAIYVNFYEVKRLNWALILHLKEKIGAKEGDVLTESQDI